MRAATAGGGVTVLRRHAIDALDLPVARCHHARGARRGAWSGAVQRTLSGPRRRGRCRRRRPRPCPRAVCARRSERGSRARRGRSPGRPRERGRAGAMAGRLGRHGRGKGRDQQHAPGGGGLVMRRVRFHADGSAAGGRCRAPDPVPRCTAAGSAGCASQPGCCRAGAEAGDRDAGVIGASGVESAPLAEQGAQKPLVEVERKRMMRVTFGFRQRCPTVVRRSQEGWLLVVVELGYNTRPPTYNGEGAWRNQRVVPPARHSKTSRPQDRRERRRRRKAPAKKRRSRRAGSSGQEGDGRSDGQEGRQEGQSNGRRRHIKSAVKKASATKKLRPRKKTAAKKAASQEDRGQEGRPDRQRRRRSHQKAATAEALRQRRPRRRRPLPKKAAPEEGYAEESYARRRLRRRRRRRRRPRPKKSTKKVASKTANRKTTSKKVASTQSRRRRRHRPASAGRQEHTPRKAASKKSAATKTPSPRSSARRRNRPSRRPPSRPGASKGKGRRARKNDHAWLSSHRTTNPVSPRKTAATRCRPPSSSICPRATSPSPNEEYMNPKQLAYFRDKLRDLARPAGGRVASDHRQPARRSA